MSEAPELKCFSILLAWIEDDHEAGEYSWVGLAPDFEAAVQKAREAGARDQIELDDGAVDPPDLMDSAPSDHVLDSMEGCNMWSAPEMLTALEQAEHWLQAEADSPEPGATRPDEILRVISDAIQKAKGK